MSGFPQWQGMEPHALFPGLRGSCSLQWVDSGALGSQGALRPQFPSALKAGRSSLPQRRMVGVGAPALKVLHVCRPCLFSFQNEITALSLTRQCIFLYLPYQLEECQGEEWAFLTTEVSFWACLSRNDKEAVFQSFLLDLHFRLNVGDTRQVALSGPLPKSDLECVAVLNNALVAPSLKQQQ